MSSGTKITLAVIALFIGVIVAYYGFLMPESEPDGPRIQDPIAREDGEAAGDRANPADPGRPAIGETPQRSSSHQQPRRDGSEPPAKVAGPQPLGSEEPVLGMLGEQPPTAPPATSDPLNEPSVASPPGNADTVDPLGDPASEPGDSSDERQAARDQQPPPTAANRPETDAPAKASSSRPQPNRPASLTRSRPRIMSDYIVREGDTLYSIAEGWFGNAALWELITDANPDLDPRRLQIGQRLKLPPKDTPRRDETVRGGQSTYTVRSGDTLSSIAASVYDDERLWRRIYRVNRTAIGPNPDELTVGMKLTIPPGP